MSSAEAFPSVPVTLKIESDHVYQGAGSDRQLLETMGLLRENGGVYMVGYTDDEGAPCLLELSPDHMRYIRNAGREEESALFFRQGEKASSFYSTPYGVVPVETEAMSYKMRKGISSVLMARVRYRLYSEGTCFSEAKMTINIHGKA